MTNIILIFFSQASAVIDLIGFPSYINNHTLLNKEYEDVRFTLSIFFLFGGGGVTCVLEERGWKGCMNFCFDVSSLYEIVNIKWE